MPGKSPRRQVFTIACRCGAHAAVDLTTFGRPQTCRSCRISFTVVWKKNPRNGEAVPVAVAQARKSGQKEGGAGGPDGPKMFLVCACGYRRAVRPEEAARNNRCPGCGKWMFVEKPASPKPAAKSQPLPDVPLRPAPLPPAASEPPPPDTPIGARAVLCPCGERLLVGLDFLGKEARCPACKQVLKLQGYRDPQTFVTQIRAVIRDANDGVAALADLAPAQPKPAPRPSPRPPAPAQPQTPPAGATEVPCACGQRLYLLPSQAGKEIACTACGRLVQVEKRRDPQTLVTTIRPVFRPGPAAAKPEPPPPPPETQEEVPFLEPLSGEPVPEDAEAFPATVAPNAQEVICKCGEELLIGPEDAGRHVQCPSCGVLMEIEGGPGALRVRAVGQMDDGTWSLEDFS